MSKRAGRGRNLSAASESNVRHLDIVTHMPPTWLRYRHTGIHMYIDRNGEIRPPTAKWRADDRWAGFVDGVRVRRFDHFGDHAITNYVSHLTRVLSSVAAERIVRSRR